jgi:fumarate reductase flavoprotein subunit
MNTLEADVVVVAGGASGLSAAVSAAERGAKVVVFEKASTTGGSGNMAGGLFAVESRLQRIRQVGPTREEAFRIFMDYTHWRAPARLVKAYVDKSADTIDWLEKLGVQFTEPAAVFLGSHPTWHLIRSAAEPMPGGFSHQAAGTMIRILTDRAKGMGVKILLQTPVTRILKQAGRIVGVAAEDKSGHPLQADARAVIVATGGFGDNPDMIRKYTGYEYGKDLFSFRIPGVTGDGIRMAWEVGAAPTEMNMELVYGMPGELEPVVFSLFRQPGLLVNLLGERFVNEEVLRNPAFAGNAISGQKGRAAFLVFDHNSMRYFEEKGLDFLGIPIPFTKMDNLDGEISNALGQGYKDIYVADSIEALAVKIGVDADVFLRAIREYNESCEKGYDSLFNKNHRYLRPVAKPKFYAGRLVPTGYGTLGGIKINHNTEVLTKDWKVIPGLYAAGTDACSIYGDTYVFVLPGNTLGFAINSGRIAGENASEYAKSVGGQVPVASRP